MLSASKSGSAGGASGYNLTRSLRFRSSATAYLGRTPATTTNQQTWTFSAWIKRGTVNVDILSLFSAAVDGDNFTTLSWADNVAGALTFVYVIGGVDTVRIVTTQVFRDPSAWYHIVAVADTTNATASNRMKLYVNGVQVTAFSYASYPAQNTNLFVNSANSHGIGVTRAVGRYYDGYMTEINLIDGQALTPSSFGSTNATTGVWQPARYTGTYGTNGFYLPFTDNSALTTSSNVGLGKDFSGNGNYWTTNNISITAGVTYDSMTDVPTLTSATAANFAVLNPLFNSSVTVSAGNLNAAVPGAGYQNSVSTIAFPTSGKFYFEVTIVSNGGSGNNQQMGITALPIGVYNFGLDCFATSATSARKISNGAVGADLYGPVSNGTIFGVAVDATNGKAYIAVNNTYIDSSSPSGGTGGYSMTSGQQYFAYFNGYSSGVNAYNFGQRPFSYTPPTGFLSLNSFNLPDSTIVKGNTVFDATLYSGNLIGQTITNASAFKPDLVWVKSRSAATDNKLTDSVRGATLALVSNSTAAETTDVTGVVSFNSNGFTLGTSTTYNNTGATYVGWQWQAGQGSSSSNTNGSITSTVSVNASAGFSVVTYTGNGSGGQSVGHGLGVTPSVVLIKNRSGAADWIFYSKLTGSSTYLFLNSTAAASADTVTQTSTVFTIGTASTVNGNGATYVAYCWTPIVGYSAFGSYTGNGSSDGTFVYTGFRPKFVMMKSTGTGDWWIYDTSRSTYNAAILYLYADTAAAEVSDATEALDILSNGFKLRVVGNYNPNTNGQSFIYMAFAENPLKNALAR